MAATRTAEAHWEGSLKEGQGEVELISSGSGSFEASWPARTEEPNGKTSPEELIAAAHSSCFSMAFSNELAKAGFVADRVEIRVDPANTASAGIPRKLGYREEATLRRRLPWSDGSGRRDVVVFTLFADELASTPCAEVAVAAFDAVGERLL
jgi:organic hydroperoxide reductase OsmC/OhrA